MHNPQISLYPGLLKAADPSSICLNCHAGSNPLNSYNIATFDGSALTPGGDFYWLKKNFAWLGGSSPGERHGHNIIAMDFGFTADTTLTVAPGGTYRAENLACNSCHDPHGMVNSSLSVSGSGSYGATPQSGTVLGNYRLLGSSGYNGGRQAQGYSFSYGVPAARANPVIITESDNSHVDYGSGMSEWCANCHLRFLTNEHDKKPDNRGFEHPSGNDKHLERAMIDTYNTYIKTGDFSGNAETSYLALVPFERGITDTTLLDPASTGGPDADSNVMCLTCHRAHASAFRVIGRWDFDAELIVNSHPAKGDSGVTGNDVFYSYYGRDMVAEFGELQKPFCEKCHGKVPGMDH